MNQELLELSLEVQELVPDAVTIESREKPGMGFVPELDRYLVLLLTLYYVKIDQDVIKAKLGKTADGFVAYKGFFARIYQNSPPTYEEIRDYEHKTIETIPIPTGK